MNTKCTVLLMTLVLLALGACSVEGIPVEDLATEMAANRATPTLPPTETPTPTLTPTPMPSVSLEDPSGDCVTGFFAPIDCSVLQRDVTGIDLVSDGRTLTITVTIEGEPWGQAPDHYVALQFDADMDSATGSRTLGIEHGMGTDTNVFWGWTSATLPFGGEHYNEVGTLTESFGERDELVTIVDDQTLQLEIPIREIGSDTFNFVFSLEAPPGIDVFDYVPEQGASLSFPTGKTSPVETTEG